MVTISHEAYLTPEEYLAAEASSQIKHEYWDGEVYAMAGATDPHVTIAGNLFAVLRSHVRGSGCRVFLSDMKAQIIRRNCYFYPDVMVTCDPRDRETPMFKSYPSLIVEVSSDSTEGFDPCGICEAARGRKFADYRTLESLKEYVVISQTRRQVDCFRRNAAEQWVLYPFQDDDTVDFASVDLQIDMDVLYEDVVLSDPAPEPTEK